MTLERSSPSQDPNPPPSDGASDGGSSNAAPTLDDTQGRRRFLGVLSGLGVLWLGALIYPIYRYLSPQAQPDIFGPDGKVKVDKIGPAEVAQPGQGKNGGYGGRGLIVLRTDDGKLRAFDAKCTHAGCNVSFAGTQLVCPCHGGVYDLKGKNIAGPPPQPLATLDVFEEDGVLFVRRPGTQKEKS